MKIVCVDTSTTAVIKLGTFDYYKSIAIVTDVGLYQSLLIE
ncbi:hypothetical protein RINTHH_10790 [Richelia intracellularis HH01]|uniref:Uncharacterized protein n=1 Tax=Richelia intracellularis HH01 TaxID=1165094 RepID=M1WS49_9NOST|nr:hypothetical protein RINTHH_10790 [Richelia intracellularis HH01]